MAYFRHVDAGGEQINGDGDGRIALLLIVPDQFINPIALAGNLPNRVLVVVVAVELLKLFIQLCFNHVGVQIGHAEYHHLFIAKGVKFFCQRFTDDPVEVGGNHATVKGFDFKVEIIFQLSLIHFAGTDINHFDFFTFFKPDSLFRQTSAVADGRLMVDQPVVGHGFAVGVGVDGFSENIGSVFGGGGRHPNLYGIKVIQYPAIA